MYSRDVITSFGLCAGGPYSSIYIFIFSTSDLLELKGEKQDQIVDRAVEGSHRKWRGVSLGEYTFVMVTRNERSRRTTRRRGAKCYPATSGDHRSVPPSASFERTAQRGRIGGTCAEQEVAGSCRGFFPPLARCWGRARSRLPFSGVGNPELAGGTAAVIRLGDLR